MHTASVLFRLFAIRGPEFELGWKEPKPSESNLII